MDTAPKVGDQVWTICDSIESNTDCMYGNYPPREPWLIQITEIDGRLIEGSCVCHDGTIDDDTNASIMTTSLRRLFVTESEANKAYVAGVCDYVLTAVEDLEKLLATDFLATHGGQVMAELRSRLAKFGEQVQELRTEVE